MLTIEIFSIMLIIVIFALAVLRVPVILLRVIDRLYQPGVKETFFVSPTIKDTC